MYDSIAKVGGKYNVDIAEYFDEILIDCHPLSHPFFIDSYVKRLPKCYVGIPEFKPFSESDAVRIAKEYIMRERANFNYIINTIALNNDWKISFSWLIHLQKLLYALYHPIDKVYTYESTNKFLKFELDLIREKRLVILEDGTFWSGFPPYPQKVLVSRSYPVTRLLKDKFAHLLEIDTKNIVSLNFDNPFIEVINGKYSEEIMHNIDSCAKNLVFNDKLLNQEQAKEPIEIPEIISQIPPLAEIWDELAQSKTLEFDHKKHDNDKSLEERIKNAFHEAINYTESLSQIIVEFILPLQPDRKMAYIAELCPESIKAGTLRTAKNRHLKKQGKGL